MKAKTEERWRRLIGAQARSGMTIQNDCAEHGVSAASFCAWRRRPGVSQVMKFAVVERAGQLDGGIEALAIPAEAGCGNLAEDAGRDPRAAMMPLPASVRVYLVPALFDLREEFRRTGRPRLQFDAFAGHLFVFTNRPRDGEDFLLGPGGFAIWPAPTGVWKLQ